MTTTVKVSTADVEAVVPTVSGSLNLKEWTVSEWAASMDIPLDGAITNADVWMIWAAIKLREIGIVADDETLDMFCSHWPVFKPYEEIIQDVLDEYDDLDGNWAQMFKDYVLPFGKQRKGVSRLLIDTWTDVDIDYRLERQRLIDAVKAFMSEYKYTIDMNPSPFHDLFDEWFLVRYFPEYEKTTGSITAKLYQFRSLYPELMSLHQTLSIMLHGRRDFVDYLDVCAIWFAQPKNIKLISANPFLGKDRPAFVHNQVIEYHPSKRNFKIACLPTSKDDDDETGGSAVEIVTRGLALIRSMKDQQTEEEQERLKLPFDQGDSTESPPYVKRPDPHNCKHEYVPISTENPGTSWIQCEHCLNVQQVVN